MLQKTLRFEDAVLNVLQTMDWKDAGRLGTITSGQLSRTLYLQVNKALKAMGGKWSRKREGHVFQIDPREQVEGLLHSGGLQVERDGFFETPANIVKRMLELAHISPGDLVLEPSAGLGAIAKFIRLLPCILHVCEKNQERAARLIADGYDLVGYDFLALAGQRYDKIVMNPPFEKRQDADHVRHAYGLLVAGGVLISVMSEGMFFRSDRKAIEFQEWLSTTGRSEKLPDKAFKESGTGVSTRLVLITKGMTLEAS